VLLLLSLLLLRMANQNDVAVAVDGLVETTMLSPDHLSAAGKGLVRVEATTKKLPWRASGRTTEGSIREDLRSSWLLVSARFGLLVASGFDVVVVGCFKHAIT
jgi:hypothetical protein